MIFVYLFICLWVVCLILAYWISKPLPIQYINRKDNVISSLPLKTEKRGWLKKLFDR